MQSPSNALVRGIRQTSREMVRELGLLKLPASSMPRCHALIELSEHGSLTVIQLADRLQIDKSYASRVVANLVKEGLVVYGQNQEDRRQKPLVLSERGQAELAAIHQQADHQVAQALKCLAIEEQQAVLNGLALYGKALNRARQKEAFTIRPITLKDNPEVARLIRAVLTEYGANKPGFAFADPELDYMFETYNQLRSAYFVVEFQGRVVGGGGYAPLRGDTDNVCELQKMYFLQETRSYGLGADILSACLELAQANGFRGCYLETLTHMERAQRLYRGFGFKPLPSPMGQTGHCGCDSFYYKDFSQEGSN